jgi:predicted transcriptional regulator
MAAQVERFDTREERDERYAELLEKKQEAIAISFSPRVRVRPPIKLAYSGRVVGRKTHSKFGLIKFTDSERKIKGHSFGRVVWFLAWSA